MHMQSLNNWFYTILVHGIGHYMDKNSVMKIIMAVYYWGRHWFISAFDHSLIRQSRANYNQILSLTIYITLLHRCH